MHAMSAAADRLRKWVERNGPSITDATRAIGCQWGQLRDWMRGSATPGLVWAVRIQRATGIAVDAWVEEKPAKRRAKRAA